MELNPLFIDQVYGRLLDAISLGDLKPGQRVRQAALADKLGVSRQPVSHALQLLKRQGLVRDAGRQGVEVAPIDPDYVVHLYVARTHLEETAAQLAATRVASGVAAENDKKELEDAVQYGCQILENETDISTLVKADALFHRAVYRLSGNPVIEEMMMGQWPHLMRSMLQVLDDPGVPVRAWTEHQAIARFILLGDKVKAASAAVNHIKRAGHDLRQRLKSDVPLAR